MKTIAIVRALTVWRTLVQAETQQLSTYRYWQIYRRQFLRHYLIASAVAA